MRELACFKNALGEEGLNLYMPQGHIYRTMLGNGGKFESDVRDFIKAWVRPEGIFIDVGAHCGLFSCLAAKIVGDRGNIIAIEPVEYLAHLCGINLKFNGAEKITVVNAAATSNERDAGSYIDLAINKGNNDGDNRVVNIPDNLDNEWNLEQCFSCTVDREFYSNTVNEPLMNRSIFLKIDAQWAEIEVLQGASNILSIVNAGIVEVQSTTRDQVIEILECKNFNLKDLGTDIAFWREGITNIK